MSLTPPVFPPLLTGKKVPSIEAIHRDVAAGAYGAGDFLWSEPGDDLCFALVLEPEVPVRRCAEILALALVAVGDAIGALAPPEVSVTCAWPGMLLLNGARCATFDLQLAPTPDDGIPDWMVLYAKVAFLPPETAPEPGHSITRTSLWDEGCGNIQPIDLMESAARHLVSAIHTWETDGFGRSRRGYMDRRSDDMSLHPELRGTLVGVDQHGNAIVSVDDKTEVLDALTSLRQVNR